jgi:hypothetical protein
MRTARQIIQWYWEGRITATGLILELLDQTDESVITETLENLPPEVVKRLRKTVSYYSPKTLVFGGPTPRMPTVQFVKDWFARFDQSHEEVPTSIKDPTP